MIRPGKLKHRPVVGRTAKCCSPIEIARLINDEFAQRLCAICSIKVYERREGVVVNAAKLKCRAVTIQAPALRHAK